MKQILFLLLSLFCATSTVHAAEALDPEKAFEPSLEAPDAHTLTIRFKIADGYYLYRHRFAFASKTPGIALGQAQIPNGKPKQDENFGQVETYRTALNIPLPLSQGDSSNAVISVSYQGCADIGVCYPPVTRELRVSTAAPSLAQAIKRLEQTPSPKASPPLTDEANRIASQLSGGKLALSLLAFFGAGLGLSFTPCMLPMLPILSGIIVGHGPSISRTRSFVLASAYVIGMALSYAVAGVAAGLSGTLLASALQNVWVLGTFALIFIVLSGAMFGFYELQLPAALQSRISRSANNQRAGSLAGVAVMGALSALIVGPCVAAPLAGALLFIARSGNGLLGGLALFVLALGMGFPLLIAATAARELLPRVGPWMESVKKAFGVILLALAIWLLTPVLPVFALMLAWAVLLIVSAIFLHAIDPLPSHAPGWHRFWKGIGVIALLAGAALLIGALGGSRDLLQPLVFLRGASAAPSTTLRQEKVTSTAELDRRLAEGRPVMVDFYADWCVSCREMERLTFSDARVHAALGKTLVLKIDVTANTAEDRALLKRFDLFGPPGIVFFNAHGEEIAGTRLIGYQKTEDFLAALKQRGV